MDISRFKKKKPFSFYLYLGWWRETNIQRVLHEAQALEQNAGFQLDRDAIRLGGEIHLQLPRGGEDAAADDRVPANSGLRPALVIPIKVFEQLRRRIQNRLGKIQPVAEISQPPMHRLDVLVE